MLKYTGHQLSRLLVVNSTRAPTSASLCTENKLNAPYTNHMSGNMWDATATNRQSAKEASFHCSR